MDLGVEGLGSAGAYAGTHDNETAVGWWKDSAGDVDREYLAAYTGSEGAPDDIAWLFIRQAFSSVSHTSIVMMQVRPSSLPACCRRTGSSR